MQIDQQERWSKNSECNPQLQLEALTIIFKYIDNNPIRIDEEDKNMLATRRFDFRKKTTDLKYESLKSPLFGKHLDIINEDSRLS